MNAPNQVGFASQDISSYVKYERAKAAWQLGNPGCTPAEYEAAVKRIAEECGV